MFERYSEHAKRVIFFARNEAVQLGSREIEPEHLLLGLLLDSRSRANLLFGLRKYGQDFRLKIERKQPRPVQHPRNADMLLSDSSKWVLAYTAEEADQAVSKSIDTEHIVLGLLREGKSFAATLLSEIGVDPASARKLIKSRATTTSELKAIAPVVGIGLVLLLFIIYSIAKLLLGK